MKIVMEHSADRLVSTLRMIVDDFEKVAKGQGQLISNGSLDVTGASDAYDPCDGANFGAECYSAEDRWFIICSCPLGFVSLIPTLLSITAFVLSSVGNNLCNLFRRQVLHGPIYLSSDVTLGSAEEVVDVTLGLYTHGVAYVAESLDVLQCSKALTDNETGGDTFIKMAVGPSRDAFTLESHSDHCSLEGLCCSWPHHRIPCDMLARTVKLYGAQP